MDCEPGCFPECPQHKKTLVAISFTEDRKVMFLHAPARSSLPLVSLSKYQFFHTFPVITPALTLAFDFQSGQ